MARGLLISWPGTPVPIGQPQGRGRIPKPSLGRAAMLRASHRRLVALTSALIALSLAHAGIGVPRALALPPALTVPGSQTVPESQSLAFAVTATDPEGELCGPRAADLPGGARLPENPNNNRP